MFDQILNTAAQIDRILWGPWTLLFIAGVALFLTVKSKAFQFQKLGFIFKNTFGKIFHKIQIRNKGRMTPFQATSTALASTVGMGNIAGVATALSLGGPGAIFWMWVLALLSMIVKTAEITLAVHYREVDENGTLHGGPMYYIRKGLGWTALAKLFAVGVLVNSLLSATLLQQHTVGRAFLSSYKINPYLTTGGMAVLTGVVVIGGIRRIGRVCERLVPMMSVVYVLAGLAVFVINYAQIPEVFGMIFKHAFAPLPAAGGLAGVAVRAALKEGMAKGMLSNEAGLGTAPMAHATAETPHPFQQGLWGAFETFVDTIIICTITSFAVLSTGLLRGGKSGIELVIDSFSTVFPPWLAGSLISFSILTFCLSTQIGFFIYYETSLITLFGKRSIRTLKWFYLVPGVLFAGVTDVNKLWVFANISVGMCALPNLVALLALNGAFFKLMKDFMKEQNQYTTLKVDSSRDFVVKANRSRQNL
ncbi:MAG: amino acid carrier protein [Candidatus Aminicenantes bacterium]|nr:amino acid carrier protein [Candidatus Aminicenantes bacterium]